MNAMNLEQQVTSLELSKHLYELCGKQESTFAWHESAEAGTQLVNLAGESTNARIYGDFVPAFTVAELGEMLPAYIHLISRSGRKCKYPNHFCAYKEKDHWKAIYLKTRSYETHWESGDTEADARGKMLAYLIENKLITL